MASYFDLPPQETAPAVLKEELDEYKGSSLLSPQVSRILDDLDFEDGSSSDDNNDDEKEEGETSPSATPPSDLTATKPRSNTGTRKSRLGSVELAPEEPLPTAQATPGKETKEAKVSASRVTAKPKSSKPRHAHMERFKSLRSVLFLSNIEDNMNRARREEQGPEDPAVAWKAQHEKRQGFNRPSTPDKANEKVKEKENDPSQKDHLTSRMAMKIRRLTSHSTPMTQIPETNQEPSETTALTRRDSTATDTDEEPTPQHPNTWRPRADSETSIDHSDIDELVRWVSRRDPPSDGEASLPPSSPRNAAPQDKDNKSLAPSDIPHLVQHASRLSIPTTSAVQFHPDSDASTASDDEVESEEEDTEELMRWVSRRDGSMAGPVRGRDAAVEKGYGGDSDVPEMGSWGTRRSQEGTGETRGRTMERSSGEGSQERKGLTEEDVDELVRWVSRRDSKGGGETVVREKGIAV